MSFKSLSEFIADQPNALFEEIAGTNDREVHRIEGLVGSSAALVIAKSFLLHNQPTLVVCSSAKESERMQDDLESFLSQEVVKLFPQWNSGIYDGLSPFGHTAEIRAEAVNSLLLKNPCIVVTTVHALLQKMAPPRDVLKNTITLEEGGTVDLDELRRDLVRNGFTPASMVEEIGSFSVRGGIMDIFPFLYDQPIRIELWGDTVESIRSFDVFSQRSSSKLDRIAILPLTAFVLDPEDIDGGIESMKDALPQDKEAIDTLHTSLLNDSRDSGIEWHIGWFLKDFSGLTDYFPQNALMFEIQSPQGIEESAAQVFEAYSSSIERNASPSLYSPPADLLYSLETLQEMLCAFKRTQIGYFRSGQKSRELKVREQPKYAGSLDELRSDIDSLDARHFATALLCDNAGQAERLAELLEEAVDRVTLVIGSISNGFIFDDLKLALYTDHQIFNRYSRKIKYRKYKGGTSIPDFHALTPGDFVVHNDHGIGRFFGISRVSAGGALRDCMEIHYEGRNKLFVPVEKFEKIQKYVGKDGTPPILSKLGSGRWEKSKARTKKAILLLAHELVELYAKRRIHPGHEFGKDTHWQKEFEDAFIFEETPDQIRAADQIKQDMHKSVPMDRLVCGDVGFGKTEVALRAIFKCVMEGKQVATLVPTTILAAQHLQTFKERMADFPVKTEMLSRFVTPKERKAIIQRLSKGETDVIVGTHRLLSKDIVFKDLGLLIVDEEHRFGVSHKEKIKQIKSNVDVISMTATPIPRTLHMSMVGVRDISLINTPPLNRLSVQTRVMEYRSEVVKEAVLAEIEREGQVYFVHNRVKSINEIATNLERLVPSARIAIAHGQMNERDLEKIMDSFMKGHFDVLVSTDIIESGLDIPNVNTLIINRADMFGLAQLYQLRGRVGRSSIQAYAYMLTPPFGHLKDDSVKRLKTLEQFTDLGSGFQIAMRDLEIRGAGNLLGTQQHGFIAAVGFEMYARLLKEAMQELKGESVETAIDPQIEMDAEAFLPEDYIEDAEQRIAIYQRISQKTTIEALKEAEEELIDRFGEIPDQAKALLAIMSMKIIGRKYFFEKVTIRSGRLTLNFFRDLEPDQKQLGLIIEKIKRPFELKYETPIRIIIELSETDPILRVQQARRTIEAMD